MRLLILLGFLYGYGIQAQEFYRIIPNKGQWTSPEKYRVRADGSTLYLLDDGFVVNTVDYSELNKWHGKNGTVPVASNVVIKSHAYQVKLKGAAKPSWSSAGESSEYYNYYLGNNSANWKSKVHAAEAVQMNDIYQGITMKWYTESMQLKYEFHVSPGVNASIIKMEYNGANSLLVNKKGQLEVATSLGKVIEDKPYAYQIVNGNLKIVPCDFLLSGNEVSFSFPSGYNQNAPLVIDPTLIFSTFSGSVADNFGMTATYDLQGNLYSGGTVFNNGFPTTLGAYSSTFSGIVGQGITDVIITKYNPSGTAQVYSTYFGGVECETVHSLIVNEQDELFFFGVTSSPDFPISSNAFDQSFNGGTPYSSVANGTNFTIGTDIYVSKLSADGTAMLGSTYIGGSLNDGMNYPNALNYDTLQYNYGDQFRGEVMVDAAGNCFVATCTRSADFPIVNGFGTTLSGGQAGVVFKFNPDLSSLEWSTYLNGQNKDAAYSLKVNDVGEVFVTGGTSSPNFPVTAGAYQTAFLGGKVDAFVTHISADGTAILHSTFLGTNQYDQAYFVEIDRFGNVHIVGQTRGPSAFPVTAGAYINPGSCQFITSLNATLSAINYSTIFGNGNGLVNISPSAFLVDVCGNIYVAGWGGGIAGSLQQPNALAGMPITPDAVFPTAPNGYDFYLIVFEKNAQGLLYGSYFGGNQSQEHVDGGTSRFDSNGIVYQSVCAGCGGFSDFPTTPGAWSATNNAVGRCNNGMFKFDFEIVPVADFTVSNVSGCAPLEITFTNNSINSGNSNYLWDFGNNDTTSIIPNPTHIFTTPGTYQVYLYIEDTTCLLIDTALQVITVYPELSLTPASDTVWICEAGNATISAIATGHDGNYIWSSNAGFTDTLNIVLTNPSLTVFVPDPAWYYLQVQNTGCSLVDSVFVGFTSSGFVALPDITICLGETGTLGVVYLSPHDPVVSWNWEPDSILVAGQGTAFVSIQPTQSQFAYVTATTSLGCVFHDSIYVTVIAAGVSLNAFAMEDTLLLGQSTSLLVTPAGLNYTWTPSTHLNISIGDSVVATPTIPDWHTYLVTTGVGNCELTDTVRVFVYEWVCGPPYVFVPNAFTPDGSGHNDQLKVYGRHLDKIYFTVYDRWGEKMFETTDINVGWDGTFKGRPCDPAVYVWYVEALCIDGQEYFDKGNVTLIR